MPGRRSLATATVYGNGLVRLPAGFGHEFERIKVTWSGKTLKFERADPGEMGYKPYLAAGAQSVVLNIRRVFGLMGVVPEAVAGEYASKVTRQVLTLSVKGRRQ